MRQYELAIIFRSDKEEHEVKRDMEAVKALLEGIDGCTVVSMDPWNRRKLAYPIKNHFYGFYVVYVLEVEIPSLKRIREELNLLEFVIRYMLVKKEESSSRQESSFSPQTLSS